MLPPDPPPAVLQIFGAPSVDRVPLMVNVPKVVILIAPPPALPLQPDPPPPPDPKSIGEERDP